MAQLSLAWLLHQGDYILPIPGTTNYNHLKDNMAASQIKLSRQQLERLDQGFAAHKISGPGYPASTQPEIDTEEF